MTTTVQWAVGLAALVGLGAGPMSAQAQAQVQARAQTQTQATELPASTRLAMPGGATSLA